MSDLITLVFTYSLVFLFLQLFYLFHPNIKLKVGTINNYIILLVSIMGYIY